MQRSTLVGLISKGIKKIGLVLRVENISNPVHSVKNKTRKLTSTYFGLSSHYQFGVNISFKFGVRNIVYYISPPYKRICWLKIKTSLGEIVFEIPTNYRGNTFYSPLHWSYGQKRIVTLYSSDFAFFPFHSVKLNWSTGVLWGNGVVVQESRKKSTIEASSPKSSQCTAKLLKCNQDSGYLHRVSSNSNSYTYHMNIKTEVGYPFLL